MHHNQSVAATGSRPQVRLRLIRRIRRKKNNKWLSSVSATTVAARPSPRRPPINEQDSDMLELRLPRFWQRKTWSCRLPRNHRRRKYFAFTITEMMPLNFIAFCFCLLFFSTLPAHRKLPRKTSSYSTLFHSSMQCVSVSTLIVVFFSPPFARVGVFQRALGRRLLQENCNERRWEESRETARGGGGGKKQKR